MRALWSGLFSRLWLYNCSQTLPLPARARTHTHTHTHTHTLFLWLPRSLHTLSAPQDFQFFVGWCLTCLSFELISSPAEPALPRSSELGTVDPPGASSRCPSHSKNSAVLFILWTGASSQRAIHRHDPSRMFMQSVQEYFTGETFSSKD